MPELSTLLRLHCGPARPNRITLAPLTNWQSHDDGTLGEDEYRWLTMRARGGFGMVMTCAAHVQAEGLGQAFLHYVANTWPRFVADA